MVLIGEASHGTREFYAARAAMTRLTEYLQHYNIVRPHRSLDLRPPRPASRLALVESGTVEAPVQRVDVLGGLIHEYHRAA